MSIWEGWVRISFSHKLINLHYKICFSIQKSDISLLDCGINFFTPIIFRYGRLLSFTGTIFDYDTDGRADATVKSDYFSFFLSRFLLLKWFVKNSPALFIHWNLTEISVWQPENICSSSIPSHIFRILLSCRHWDSDSSCSDPSESAVISWMIPHIELDFNCLVRPTLNAVEFMFFDRRMRYYRNV